MGCARAAHIKVEQRTVQRGGRVIVGIVGCQHLRRQQRSAAATPRVSVYVRRPVVVRH